MISSVLKENILVSKENDTDCQGLLGLFLHPVLTRVQSDETLHMLVRTAPYIHVDVTYLSTR